MPIGARRRGRSRRSVAQAIAERFAPIARLLGVHGGSLPARPSARRLPEIAASSARREVLRRELCDAGASLVVTLGQEALDSVAAVVDRVGGVQRQLAPDGYGRPGTASVAGHAFQLQPLVHPGFIRQTKRAEWLSALEAWEAEPPTS